MKDTVTEKQRAALLAMLDAGDQEWRTPKRLGVHATVLSTLYQRGLVVRRYGIGRHGRLSTHYKLTANGRRWAKGMRRGECSTEV